MVVVKCKSCNNIFDGGIQEHTYKLDSGEIVGPYCPDCFSRIRFCKHCGYHVISMYKSSKKPYICSYCTTKKMIAAKLDTNKCDGCGQYKSTLNNLPGYSLCDACIIIHTKVCDVCGKPHLTHALINKQNPAYLGYSKDLVNNNINIVNKECLDKYVADKKLQAQCVYLCKRCGQHTLDEEFCEECKDYLKPCEICKKPSYDDISTIDGLICSDCFESKQYIKCSCCSLYERIKISHKNKQNLKYLCSICSEKKIICDKCNCIRNKNASVELGQYTLCEICDKYEEYLTCPKCGKVYLESSSGGVCRTCYNKGGYAKVLYWDYTPTTFYKYGNNKDGLYFGFENEVYLKDYSEMNSTLAKILKHYNTEQLYCVFDGSIGGIPYGEDGHGKSGFELISHIYSFSEFNRTNWSYMFNENTDTHITCGMHIHLSKAAFTTLHLYKFMKFIYKNKEFIEFISERKFSKYAKNFDGSLKYEAKVKWKAVSKEARRVKVNLCNKLTVGLRFFAAVTSENQLKKNMEFAHSLFYFTRDSKIKWSISPYRFKRYINKNKDIYPNLYIFINKDK